MSNTRHFALLLSAITLTVGLAMAQQGDLRLMAAKYKADREELRSYDWTRRTEVLVRGDLRETTLSRLHWLTTSGRRQHLLKCRSTYRRHWESPWRLQLWRAR